MGAMLFCILFSASFAFGQSANTSLRGTVKDPSGALVPDATVTIVDKSVDKTLTAVTNGEGSYQFAQIPPARYAITVTAQGLGSQTKIAELLVNQPATIDFKMSIAADAVTVDVSASAQTLNTTDATIGNSVNNETIQALPMDGRDPISLLSLQPGVLYLGETITLDMKTAASSVDSRQGAVSGSRSDQGNVTLDGVDDNDQANGFAFNGVLRSTLDSTEEFRVTTSNSNADAGRSSGAQVNLVTKSGTNRLHGSAYEYNRPSNTVANDWFLKEQQVSSGLENRPTKYIVNTFGGSLGGPLWKDKLFFFGNYEAQRLATNNTVSATTPSATFLAGQLGYITDTGATQLLTSQQIATLDKDCTKCTTPGVDQAILSYLGTEPAATVLAGGDGVNNGTYNFSSPAPSSLNTSIFKIDYNINANNHFFGRGNLQKDTLAGSENLPGQPPADTYSDNSKGIAFGETFTAGPNISNDLRYAYIRQGYSDSGIGQGDYVSIRFLTQPTAQTRDTIVSVPVHTINDTLSITKGNHSIGIGGSWRMITNNTATNASSFNGASTNPSYLNAKDAPDPTTLGLPAVGANFITSFNQAYATIVGDVAERNSNANYQVTSLTSASLLADGAVIQRHFRSNEFEYYVQDSWRVKPNLTITFGVRHTMLQTPYETNGQEIAPTIDTHQWFLNRGIAASKGQVDQPDLYFAPVGKANGRPAFWARQKLNLAPRMSIVYSPDTKTSIRAGAGMYFDHYGEALSHRFATLGSFGLANNFQSQAGSVKFEDAPRFTGPHDLPDLPVPAAPTKQAYPYAVPDGTFGINWGIDNHVHTPYVEAFDLSVQRELPGGFLLDVAYVGRLGRHLFQQLDLAEPVNFVDPKGAGDYFTAGSQLSKITDQLGGAYGGIFTSDPAVYVPKIQYFEDVFPQMKGLDFAGESATEAIYNAEWAPYRYNYGETQGLDDLDFACYYGCPNGTEFWDQQFSSLISLSSIGMSYYNAAQLTLRHPTKHGLNVDVSYTYSRSIDMGSDAERSATSYGAIQNSWNPSLSRGVSDFDATHLVTADWSYALPFGRGKSVFGGANRAADAVIGGWQWAGLGRWTSGLPFSLIEPGWTTNWELQAWAVPTTKVKLHKHIEGGLPQIFAEDAKVDGGIYNGSPVRLPYPGEAGPRNDFRGDGVFDVDSSLAKSWNLPERAKLKFTWEVYNVSNSIRFDTASLGNALTYPGFGFYSSRLGTKTFRRMQFGLRLDF
jgi:hypothetical protein